MSSSYVVSVFYAANRKNECIRLFYYLARFRIIAPNDLAQKL